jgi:hypothetical protein
MSLVRVRGQFACMNLTYASFALHRVHSIDLLEVADGSLVVRARLGALDCPPGRSDRLALAGGLPLAALATLVTYVASGTAAGGDQLQAATDRMLQPLVRVTRLRRLIARQPPCRLTFDICYHTIVL